jgi:hypothetical protein
VAGSIGGVRERWFSRRAVFLHLGLVLFVPGCALAAWWQITRAEDGNGLSYLYSVEWPIFAILGLYFWWMLLHTDYEDVGLRGMRNREAAAQAEVQAQALAPALVGTVADATPTDRAAPPPPPPGTGEIDEADPELAAYNARLGELAAKGPKTWRNPETVVARRPR